MQIMNIKKAAIYGDSISTTGYPCGGYGTLLGEKLGIETVYNHAIGASGLTEGTPNNLVQLLEDPLNLHEDVDLAILWHGTNDWYWGAPVGIPGTADMRNPKTYVGALTEAVTRIRAAAPRARILAMTPLWRVETPDGCREKAEAWNCPNKLGFTLRDYAHALEEMSSILCFPVVDLRRLTNFNGRNTHIYQPDGVHPSDEGHRVIADILAGFLAAL